MIGQNFLVYCKASEFEVIFGITRSAPRKSTTTLGEAGKEVLVPYPADRMKAWPVSPRVNSPKNNDPEIIVPIEPESVARQANSLQLL